MAASQLATNTDNGGKDRRTIAELFPADPELMVSPEGDRKGLRSLKEQAQQRRDKLAKA